MWKIYAICKWPIKKLKFPTTYEENKNEEWLIVGTQDLKMLYDYTGINFNDLLDLDCYTYKKLLIDAFVYNMKHTEKGREWLEDAWILTQTDIDEKGLNKMLNRGWYN